MNLRFEKYPHRRWNPLTGEWVLVSPQRTRRPWKGQVEAASLEQVREYDPACPLCPGNRRGGGASNPEYIGVYAFDNDYSALLPRTPLNENSRHPFLRQEAVQGACRVLCFSPRHDLTLAIMCEEDILKVVDLWVTEVRELGRRYAWVQVFENRGEIMGCSNPHPHGQVWATSCLPNEPLKEDTSQRSYWRQYDSTLLLDYLEFELSEEKRLIVQNDHWVVLVPYWALWPFETILLPRRHMEQFTDMSADERRALAQILKRLLTRYDNLFNVSFPYTMGWHGAPQVAGKTEHWQLHAHFYPPLLRSATVKKFMVGYEMLAEAQRDITPESAAERLQSLPDIHYSLNGKNP